jgi:serine phosphatase RsbU (regulator of sigma subunit)/tetratricopeptide (TPR) repeat protein
MTKSLLISCFCLGLFLPSFSQGKIDSLRSVIRAGGHDSELMIAYTELAKWLFTNEPKNARDYLDTALVYATKLQSQPGLANIYHVYGLTYYMESNMDASLKYNLKALAIRKKLNDEEGLTRTYGNMGLIYELKGDMALSLRYHNLSLKLEEKSKNKVGIAQSLGNIGNLFMNVGSYEMALTYQFKALVILKELDDHAELAITYGNIGLIYQNLKEYKKALYYGKKSLALRIEVNNIYGEGLTLSNLALLYMSLHNRDTALLCIQQSEARNKSVGNKEGLARAYQVHGDILLTLTDSVVRAREEYQKSANLFHEVGDPNGEAIGNIGLALTCKEQNKTAEVIEYTNKAIHLLKGKGFLSTQAQAYQILYEAYQKNSNYAKAFEFQAEFFKFNDSVSHNQDILQIQKLELTREYEQRNLSDSLKRREKLAVEREKAEAKSKQQTIISISLVVGFAIVVVFLIIVFNRLRVIRKQKKEIEEGHVLLEEKNKEIVDSINYAWHIQHGMIPAPDKVKTVFPRSFVLYLPKDKLSGDFYWAANVVDKSIGELNAFAVADCTGHGVPGALVSITGINYLKLGQQIPEVNSPAEALNFVNKGFYSLFEENTGIRDGMDIVVGAYDKKSMALQYSSAKNPIIIIRNNEIIELKGDKHPIGRFGPDTPLPFTNHSFQLYSEDVMYVFSDGYVDQFGGPGAKSGKFKSGNFKKLLIEIHKKSLMEQEKILRETIIKWRGNLEQTDDITVFGVKF